MDILGSDWGEAVNLHVLFNGGDGTYDVVNIKDDGTLEYVAEGFMDGKHAAAFIEGWHAAGEYAAAPESEQSAVDLINEAYWSSTKNAAAAIQDAFRYRD